MKDNKTKQTGSNTKTKPIVVEQEEPVTTAKQEFTKNSGSNNKSDSRNRKYKQHTRRNRGGSCISKSTINEPEWYIPSESIARDTANIPFSVYNGISYDVTNGNIKKMAVPGVSVFSYLPSYGRSDSGDSALNMAVRSIYTVVRRANAGAKNYEAPDLAIYLLTMDQIYLMIHEAKRILQLAVSYNYANRDLPYKVAKALGYDLDDIVPNLPGYRARINVLIKKINTLSVPASFNLFKRRAILAGTILTDDADKISQIICANADGYYIYDGQSFLNGSAMVYVSKYDISTIREQLSTATTLNTEVESVAAATNRYNGDVITTNLSFNNLLNFIEWQVGRIYSDEDINTMSGDILKAYNEGGLYKLVELSENEDIAVSHDTDLLEQFKNATVLDVPNATLSNAKRFNTIGGKAQLIADRQFVSLAFPCSRTRDNNVTLSATPVVTQFNGMLVFAPVTLTFTGGINLAPGAGPFPQISTGWQHSITEVASVITATESLNQYILDVYKEAADYKDVLEYTRLMCGTVAFDYDTSLIRFNSSQVSEIVTLIPSLLGSLGISSQFTVTTQYLNMNNDATGNAIMRFGSALSAGTEIGLGWLVTLPPEVVTSTNTGWSALSGAKGKYKSQWFQFVTDLPQSVSPVTYQSADAYGIDGSTVLATAYINTVAKGTALNRVSISKANYSYVDNMMKGLDFSPKSYSISELEQGLNKTGLIDPTGPSFTSYASGGKFGNKTALLSKTVLDRIHDTAILGLIAKEAFAELKA